MQYIYIERTSKQFSLTFAQYTSYVTKKKLENWKQLWRQHQRHRWGNAFWLQPTWKRGMKRYTPNSKSKDEKSRSSKMTPKFVAMAWKRGMKRYTPNSKSKDGKSRSSKMTPKFLTMDGKNIHLIVGGSKDDIDLPRKSSEKVIIVGGSKDDLDEPRKSSEKVNVFGVSQHDFDERKKSREKIKSQKMLLLYNTLQKVNIQIKVDFTMINNRTSFTAIYQDHSFLCKFKVLRIKMLERMMPFTTDRSAQYLKGLVEQAEIYDNILGALKAATDSVRHIHKSKIDAMLPNRDNLFLRPMGRKRWFRG